MAMYSAYFDESGHPNNGTFMVVAGCVAEVDQWVHFEREWLEALAPLDTNIFHTNEFENRNPPFDKLTSREADDLFDKLVGIICRRVKRIFPKFFVWLTTTPSTPSMCLPNAMGFLTPYLPEAV